jgi:isopenicillin N synthase-like dioxygenase
MPNDNAAIPVIDVSPLRAEGADLAAVAAELGQACREHGFFYIRGHGVSCGLQEELEQLSRRFFAQDLDMKNRVRMQLGGRAWRGYFPVGDELTSGQPDQKEGIYFGTELPDDHPHVKAGVPLHGRNLFPELPAFRSTVLNYLSAMTELSHAMMEGLALSLGLQASYFRRQFTDDPTILFRIFHYPPLAREPAMLWSVGEHTDYGLLTILRQDENGGLQVQSQGSWIEAPPIADTFVCNIGDMLDRMTGGLYRSTPHRVSNRGTRGRLSFPFFFDPNWDAEVKPIFPDRLVADDRNQRWDGTSLQELSGTYGEYLLGKVSKVFPELSGKEL